jgi:hypothetical protein
MEWGDDGCGNDRSREKNGEGTGKLPVPFFIVPAVMKLSQPVYMMPSIFRLTTN